MPTNKWHFQFEHILAFRINWKDEDSDAGILKIPSATPSHGRGFFSRMFANAETGNNKSEIRNDSRLNPTREPELGILLTNNEADVLCDAVCGNHPDHEIALCYMPHHAFLFVDERNSIVGHLDICFQCLNYRGTPAGYANNFDIEAIAQLLQGLGVPLSNPEWENA